MSNRREFLNQVCIAGVASTTAFGMAGSLRAEEEQSDTKLTLTTLDYDPSSMLADQAAQVRYCLNVSTINNSQVDVVDQIKTAADAGYDGIELWLRDIERYQKTGGKLFDLRKRLADSGLRVESSIAFGQWVVDDPAARAKGLQDCARDMEIIRELGGRLIAAPPVGATEGAKLNLDAAAERFAKLIEIGRARDCYPQLEVWGFSVNFSTLAEVLYVLAKSDSANAYLLPDVYHLYKGGCDFANIGLLSGKMVRALHINDYPANPPRKSITDAERVFPGDGVAPLDLILRTMLENGFSGALSLELFNRDYWKRDRNEVARMGLAKMRASVASAIEV